MPIAKIDPNTKIPPAVRRLAEQAEAAFRAQHPEAAPANNDNAPIANDNTPPVEPVIVADAPQPVAEVTLQGNPEPAPASQEVNWEHRYKSMEGRYKRAENDIRAMSDQLASMQSLISTMQPVNDNTPAELRPASLLTPEEVNEYGSEFLSVVAKKAKEELSPEVVALKQQLTKLEKRLEGNAANNSAAARRTLETTLDEKIPFWRDVNVAPEFHSWLALPDLFSGAIRHELLKAAYEQNNTPRVLAFFKGFLDQEAALAPASGEPAPADDTSGKIPLETFAAPGRAKTAAATSAPAEKPTFTHAQIAQFYAESTAGKYRGREAEKNRIEGQIFEAMREGRIR